MVPVRLSCGMSRLEGVDQRDRERCGRDAHESLLRSGVGGDADVGARGQRGEGVEVEVYLARSGVRSRRQRLRFQTRWARDGFSKWGRALSTSAHSCVDEDRGRVETAFVKSWMRKWGVVWMAHGVVWSEKGVDECSGIST